MRPVNQFRVSGIVDSSSLVQLLIAEVLYLMRYSSFESRVIILLTSTN